MHTFQNSNEKPLQTQGFRWVRNTPVTYFFFADFLADFLADLAETTATFVPDFLEAEAFFFSPKILS